MNSDISIAFAGTPDFSVPCLKILHDSKYKVPIVFTQPDRPYGRGRSIRESKISSFAKKANLVLIKPDNLDDIDIKSLPKVDFFIVVAYGLIIPERILNWPRLASINVHASLLPKWRGASPIQRSLLADDAKTGISIMRMERALDTGPVYSSRSLAIKEDHNSEDLHKILSVEGAKLLLETLSKIMVHDLKPVPQKNNLSSYAHKIKKSESKVAWEKSARFIELQVRAFKPWPTCSARLSDGRVFKLIKAKAVDTKTNLSPGKIVSLNKKTINVATGSGILEISQIQKPGGKPLSIEDYLNAHSLIGVAFVN